MPLNTPGVQQPLIDFLNGIIRDDGDILFVLFAYAAIPFLIWVLCGGFRRKFLIGKHGGNVPTITVIYLSPGPSRLPHEPTVILKRRDDKFPPDDPNGDCHRN